MDGISGCRHIRKSDEAVFVHPKTVFHIWRTMCYLNFKQIADDFASIVCSILRVTFLVNSILFCKNRPSGRFLHVENEKTSGISAACFSFLQTGIMPIPDNGFVVLPVGIPLCTEKQYPGGVVQIQGIFRMGKVWVGRDFSRRSGR